MWALRLIVVCLLVAVVAGCDLGEPIGDCDPNYDGACVPNVSYDLDCPDIRASVRVVGVDHHRLDREGDGLGCEGW
jgi:hypothetical protein